MLCLPLRGSSLAYDGATWPWNEMFVGVCDTVWGPTVRLKRDADLQHRELSWFSTCQDGLLAPPVGSDHSRPRSSNGAPRNPSPYPGRSWARGMLLENSIGKFATL